MLLREICTLSMVIILIYKKGVSFCVNVIVVGVYLLIFVVILDLLISLFYPNYGLEELTLLVLEFYCPDAV